MIRAPGDYDPTWLVELVRAQMPEDTSLLTALAKCVRKVGECRCGCGDPYFVDPDSAQWEPGRCIVVRRMDGTTIIIDVSGLARSGQLRSVSGALSGRWCADWLGLGVSTPAEPGDWWVRMHYEMRDVR